MTNWREVGAFSLMQAIKIAADAMLAGIVLTPIYTALVHAHLVVWIMPVGIVYSAAMWALALPLFLVLRAVFAGVPAVVAGAGSERAFTTAGAELGAYFLAFVIQRVLFVLASAVGLTSIYAGLRSAGHAELIRPVAIAISIVFAAIFFLVFIGLRFAMRGPAAAVSASPAPPAELGLGGARVGLFEAIGAGFQRYARFRGRARRSEYWYWVLFQVLLSILFGLLLVVDLLVLQASNAIPSIIGSLSMIGSLALLLPSFAVTVRRLHDIGRSGWWLLISFVPLFGGVVLLVMTCMRGTDGPNRFGPELRDSDPQARAA